MTRDEATKVARRVRATWPAGFMDDETVQYWAEFLEHYELNDAAGALVQLQGKTMKLPPMGAFTEAIEGARARRVKCPRCGIGWPSEQRLVEHLENVHGLYRAHGRTGAV